jgi:hypothetical protein
MEVRLMDAVATKPKREIAAWRQLDTFLEKRICIVERDNFAENKAILLKKKMKHHH